MIRIRRPQLGIFLAPVLMAACNPLGGGLEQSKIDPFFQPGIPTPAAPGLTFHSPGSSPGTNSTPSFTLSLSGGGSFAPTDSVTLHTGADCSGAALSTIEPATGHTGLSVTLTVASESAQSEGSTTYRARVMNEAGFATCSTAHPTEAAQGLSYLYDNTAPTWADSVGLASATSASTTTAPQVTYTADALDGTNGSGVAGYEYSIGTSSGGTQVLTWTSTGGTPFTPGSLALSAGTTYYLNLRAKDNVDLTSTIITKSWQVASAPTLSFAAATGTTGSRGTAMSVAPTALSAGTSATVSSCTVTAGGSLPTGLSVNNSTCVISGTPTTILASTSFTLTVTNSFSQATTATVALEVNEDWSDDTNGTSNGFAAATKVGATWSTDKVILAADTDCDGNLSEGETVYTNCNELDASWAPQWSSIAAYWKMNEASWNGTANEVLDAKGSLRGVRVGNATTSSTKKLGPYSGIFDGTGDYINMGTMGNWGSSRSSGSSMSFWIKTTQTSIAAVLGVAESAGGRNTTTIRINVRADNVTTQTGGIRIGVGSDEATPKLITGAVESNTGITDGNWHHVALTINPATNTLGIYVDGEAKTVAYGAQQSPALFGNLTFPLFVGAMNNNGTANQEFNGQLDDFALWSTVLTAAEVKALYDRQAATYSGSLKSRIFDAASSNAWDGLKWVSTLPFGKELTGDANASGSITSADSETSADYSALVGSTGATSDNDLMSNLKGLYHLNEAAATAGAGNDFADSSGVGTAGEGANLTYANPGRFGRAPTFNGTNSAITMGDVLDIGTSNWTVSAWVRTNTKHFSRVVSKNPNGSASGWFLGLQNDGTVAIGLDGLFTTVAANYHDGRWHHLVGVWNRTGNATIYMDGVALTTLDISSKSATNVDTTANTCLGCRDAASAYFNGSLDEVAIWNRVLHASEILQLYRRGANRVVLQARNCADATCSTDPTWLGPALVKSGTTAPYSFFSELANNTALDANGLPTGRVNVSLPNLLFSAFSSLSFPNSRYLQYRVLLESDDTGTACSGSWCGPDLKSVTITP